MGVGLKTKLMELEKKLRVKAVFALLALAPLVLLAKLAVLQVLDIDGIVAVGFLQDQGDARTLRTETVAASRGMITDRYGQPLAVSTPVTTIWANPKEFFAFETKQEELLSKGKISVETKQLRLQEKQRNFAALAKLLNMSVKDLTARFELYKNKQFMYLSRQISPMQAEQILELKLAGVYGKEEQRRFYPAGEVTSQLLGITSMEGVGQEGIELAYEKWLQGHNGKNRVVKDLHQRTIKTLNTLEEAKPGNDLALSIDLRLQHLAYRSLKEAVTHHRADAGMIVMLDVETGEVLAMANQPAFNPNDRSSISPKGVRNRAMIDTFEPGSTVKPITMLAALESGKYKPNTIVDTNPGQIRVNNKTLLDPVNYGVLDVSGVLAKSSQVGTTKIALSLEHEAIFNTFTRLGLGQFSGVGYPGESAGLLPMRTRWNNIERANFAFGYGLTVTALQLAEVYSVFANKGVKRPVSLLKLDAPNQGEQVVDRVYAEQVAAMLEEVTGPKGTAKAAQLEVYSSAGKTGTAHKVGARGYEAGEYMAYFVGFAPAKDPKIVIAVAIDNPKGRQYYGGEVSAPVFAKVAADSLRMLNVAPDKWPRHEQLASMGGQL